VKHGKMSLAHGGGVRADGDRSRCAAGPGVKQGGLLSLLLVVLCPLSHVLMMSVMSKGHRGAGHRAPETGEHTVHASAGTAPVGDSAAVTRPRGVPETPGDVPDADIELDVTTVRVRSPRSIPALRSHTPGPLLDSCRHSGWPPGQRTPGSRLPPRRSDRPGVGRVGRPRPCQTSGLLIL